MIHLPFASLLSNFRLLASKKRKSKEEEENWMNGCGARAGRNIRVKLPLIKFQYPGQSRTRDRYLFFTFFRIKMFACVLPKRKGSSSWEIGARIAIVKGKVARVKRSNMNNECSVDPILASPVSYMSPPRSVADKKKRSFDFPRMNFTTFLMESQ